MNAITIITIGLKVHNCRLYKKNTYFVRKNIIIINRSIHYVYIYAISRVDQIMPL